MSPVAKLDINGAVLAEEGFARTFVWFLSGDEGFCRRTAGTREQDSGRRRNSELEVNVKTPDARHMLHGFEKIANRVTTGIILAALIVGAALMMRINSSCQIFGYPGIAMICLLVALGGSGWLILSILWNDFQPSNKPAVKFSHRRSDLASVFKSQHPPQAARAYFQAFMRMATDLLKVWH